MIDTHCLLLPALDDGPPHQAEAVLLARELSAQGVRRVLCTPHYSRLFPTSHAEAQERLCAFEPVLRDSGVELELSLAAEIGPGLAVAAPLEELLARTIDRRFAMIELLGDTPFSRIPSAAVPCSGTSTPSIRCGLTARCSRSSPPACSGGGGRRSRPQPGTSSTRAAPTCSEATRTARADAARI